MHSFTASFLPYIYISLRFIGIGYFCLNPDIPFLFGLRTIATMILVNNTIITLPLRYHHFDPRVFQPQPRLGRSNIDVVNHCGLC